MVEVPHKAPRVLIVEDEYYIAADLQIALQADGAEVLGPIDHLSDALCQVDKGHFDAAVLDINLWDDSAYCVAEKLWELGIPFVFATGYPSDSVGSQFSDVKWFDKPYDVDEVARHIIQMCKRSERRSGAPTLFALTPTTDCYSPREVAH